VSTLLTLMVFGCGSQSGSDGGTPPPPGATAPTISTQPADATVATGQVATFSVTAGGTAPLTYQWLRNGTALPGATSSGYSTPAAGASDDGTHYQVTVSNSAGSVTSATATLTVTVTTTTPTAWSAPTRIGADQSTGHMIFSPSLLRVAMDTAGNAIAIWSADEPPGPTATSAEVVRTSHYTPAGGWTPDVRLDVGPPSYMATYPQVGFDQAGNAVAVWDQVIGGNDEIVSAVYDASLGWQAQTTLPTNHLAALPALSVAPDGHAFVAYRDEMDAKVAMFATRFVPGVGWDTPQFLKFLIADTQSGTVNISGAGIPTVAAGANGDAVVTWRDPDGFAYAARYTGGSWQAVEQLGQTYTEVYIIAKGEPYYQESPTAAVVDAQGTIEVLFENDSGYGVRSLMAVEHTASGWSTPIDMQPGVAAPCSFGPQLGLDGAGNALAIWHFRAPTYDQAWFARKPHGAAWGTGTSIATIEVSAQTPFAVSANGSATVLYAPDINRLLAARSYTPDGGWGPEVSIDFSPGQSNIVADFGWPLNFDIAMDSQGHAIAVWPHDSPANSFDASNTVWASTSGP
jgi:Immunoglobulin I-set domain